MCCEIAENSPSDLPYNTITPGDNITHPEEPKFQARFPPKHALRGTYNEPGGFGKILSRRLHRRIAQRI